MNVIEATHRTPELLAQLTQVWEASVRATHLFLTDSEIQHIKGYVPQMLQTVPQLFLVEDAEEHPIAFMGIANHSLEMLFVSPAVRGCGIGKQLLQHGMATCAIETVTVNEQNPQALGFYEHMGFQVYQRTELDEQGEPYPLLYMRYTPLGKS